MINEFAVDKALIDVAVQIQSDTGMTLIVDGGEPYTPGADEDYIQEKVIRGSYSRPISANSTERQQGIYQLTVGTPIGNYKFYHQGKVDLLKPYFELGLASGITHNGQKVSIAQTSQSSMRKNEQQTHLLTSFEVRYNVIG